MRSIFLARIKIKHFHIVIISIRELQRVKLKRLNFPERKMNLNG